MQRTQMQLFFQKFYQPFNILLFLFICTFLYQYGDKWVTNYCAHLQLGAYVNILQWLTVFGISLIYLLTLPVCAMYVRYIYIKPLLEKRIWFLWWCIFIPNGVCSILKVVFGRARPELWLSHNQYGFYFFKFQSNYSSFPSGHTITIFALICGLSFLYPQYVILFIIPGILIAISRILLLKHYLSDVITAVYLDVVILGFIMNYTARWHKRSMDEIIGCCKTCH